MRASVYSGVGCVLLAAMVVGCASVGPRTAIDPVLREERFTAPLNTALYADIGESLFVSGSVAVVQSLRMSSGISSSMPGAYGVPFNFSISETILSPSYRAGDQTYYCAPIRDVDARFPGLGRVITDRDCVGVRAPTVNGPFEWVVDNSYHNGSDTVWHRPVEPEDGVLFTNEELIAPEAGGTLRRIEFDGYYNDLLHFRFVELDGNSRSESEYRFDAAQNSPTTVGIRGYVLEVLSVDNVGLHYRWLRIPE